MTDLTTLSTGTYVLEGSLTSNFSFPTPSTTANELIIEPTALTDSLVTGPTSNIVSIELGGNIEHFGPNDTIVLADVQTDFTNFDRSPSANSDAVKFYLLTDYAAQNSAQLYDSNGIVISNNPLVDLMYGAEEQSIGSYINAIEDALFGTVPSSGTLTISAGSGDNGDSLNEAGSETDEHTIALTLTTSDNLNPCFAAGTRIRTPSGETEVEALQSGDTVLTATGAERRVVWVGHRTLDLARHPHPELVGPVRIAAGALANGVPARDLVVSPDHALFLDGVLVQAKDLVDGTMIAPIAASPTSPISMSNWTSMTCCWQRARRPKASSIPAIAASSRTPANRSSCTPT